MRKRLVVLVMLLAMLSNMFFSNNISVYAFELREGDSIEDDENYANIEFGDTELDDDDDNNGVDYGDLDYDDALDILEENFPFCFTPHYDAQTFLANMQFAESMHTSTESLHNLPNLYISSTNRSTSSAVFA